MGKKEVFRENSQLWDRWRARGHEEVPAPWMGWGSGGTWSSTVPGENHVQKSPSGNQSEVPTGTRGV